MPCLRCMRSSALRPGASTPTRRQIFLPFCPTVYAVQLLPPFVWEDPLPPLPDAPAALSLTLTMRDVEEIDACPAALGHRLACDKAGKRWLHHPRAETYLSERIALFQRLYR